MSFLELTTNNSLSAKQTRLVEEYSSERKHPVWGSADRDKRVSANAKATRVAGIARSLRLVLKSSMKPVMNTAAVRAVVGMPSIQILSNAGIQWLVQSAICLICLLYTSDAADD